MKKSILNVASIIFATMIIYGCGGGDNSAVTDIIPKMGSENLTTKTGYNIFDNTNITRSIKANRSIYRSIEANTEDKKFVVDVLNHITSIGVATTIEQVAINNLISNIDSPDHKGVVNDMYSMFKVNKISTTSKKEVIRVFMDKISKDDYDENMLKLKSVIDFRNKIDCTTEQNLANAYAHTVGEGTFNVKEAMEEIKKEESKTKEDQKKLDNLDADAPEYADDKQYLEDSIKNSKEYIESSKESIEYISMTSIKNALYNIYDIEFYECVTYEQLQYGGEIEIKAVGDKSFTTINDDIVGIRRVSWLNKGKLTEDFFGDLDMRLNNHQKLEDNYEDFTRLDSKTLSSRNKKLYSIFFKGVKAGGVSQTFYNIDLDPRTKLPNDQYVKFFKTDFVDSKKIKSIIYSHFNALGIATFSCSQQEDIDCSKSSSFNESYAKFTRSDSAIRSKAKNSSIGDNDPLKTFFSLINKESAKQLGLISSLSVLKSKISLTHSSDMSAILSKIENEQSDSFYVESLSY